MKINIPQLKVNIVNGLLRAARETGAGNSIVKGSDIIDLIGSLADYSIAISQIKGSRSIKDIKNVLVRNHLAEDYVDYFIEEMK